MTSSFEHLEHKGTCVPSLSGQRGRHKIVTTALEPGVGRWSRLVGWVGRDAVTDQEV